MNTEVLATQEKNIDGLEIVYKLEAIHDGCLGMHNFTEQWEHTDIHIGGVTINSDGEHWIPKNYSIADLSSDFAKQGRDNPCKDAYQSLLEQFERDRVAFEAVVSVSVLKNGIELFEDTIVGTDYDHTDFDYNHDKALETMLSDYCEEFVYIESAKQTLKTLVD